MEKVRAADGGAIDAYWHVAFGLLGGVYTQA